MHSVCTTLAAPKIGGPSAKKINKLILFCIRFALSLLASMKVIVAIDSLKGCLSSLQANDAVVEGVKEMIPDAEVLPIPVSDGGEGWLEAFHHALGGELVEVNVKDPMMRTIKAQYLIKEKTAVIEIARASGLTLLTSEERNPMRATSYGTGLLVADALRRGCRHIIVGLGGSATSDCGKGMLKAIVDAFVPGGSWDDLRVLDGVKWTIATDVTNPLCGENGAAHVFAPQKGATPEMVLALDAQANKFAALSAKHFGYDCQEMPGAGAAGGLGYAFLQYMKADHRSGIELLLESLDFNHLMESASLIITGEGSADRQTLMGKLPHGILRCAQSHHVPVILIAGRIKDKQRLLDAGFAHVECINPPGFPIEEAMKPEVARKHIKQTIKRIINGITSS